ncbi:MAG: hypothetical protein ACLP6G_18370 [Terriglobales bacterium]
MESPPETVVYLAAHHALIEFLLGAPLQRLPVFQGGMPVCR